MSPGGVPGDRACGLTALDLAPHFPLYDRATRSLLHISVSSALGLFSKKGKRAARSLLHLASSGGLRLGAGILT